MATVGSTKFAIYKVRTRQFMQKLDGGVATWVSDKEQAQHFPTLQDAVAVCATVPRVDWPCASVGW